MSFTPNVIGLQQWLLGSHLRVVQTHGFVFPPHRGAGRAMKSSCGFTESPIPFIAKMVALRRKGMSYLSSHTVTRVHVFIERSELAKILTPRLA
jgi:hypothetical protein